ncbi:polysaccharide biosynthesis tyrosine autokinase [Candidatus Thiothrix sp. Deng01]|uniref:non-specific protein-tyrosine kinase n=1 Tax=Candidatus Thiothrix phosphatis TaxID=3112415 RepID=A0ABU6D3R8_9GAMM|nr:polysaccharide biosynthesis tyrosine autokinase [Candidatus Thiothrix sp. Deng01]MEB4593333.1 polysaccharide biosynthesis tyrosine autokinase [Candidatus Thiothrix sp. Deng01]
MTHRNINREMDELEPGHNLVPVQQQRAMVATGYEMAGSPDDNGDDEIDLRELWTVIKRRKGTIALIFLLVSLLALLFTLMQTPLYRASVTLEINTDDKRVLDYDVEANGAPRPTDSKDFYQTQYELLQSRNLADRVISKLKLEPRLKGEELVKPFYADSLNEIKGWLSQITPSNVSAKTTTDIGERPVSELFLENVTVSPIKNSRIVTVHYDDADPAMAATIANSLADNYINMNLERRADSTTYARKFLEEQLVQTKSKLEESENKLVQYAKDKSIYNTDDKQNLVGQKLQELSAALTEAEKDRIAAESQYKQSMGSKSQDRVQSSMVIQQLKASKAKLQTDYQDKLKIYKPDYPLMQQLQSQINELDAQINSESSLERSTAQTTLKSDYMAAKQKEDQLRAEVDKYKAELLTTQDKSIGYNTLQREVETNRQLYEGLLQRVKEVNVAGLANTNNVSIVDPAIVPFEVEKPNLKLNLALGVVLGLFLGTVAAFLLEFLDDRIKSIDDLERVLPVPILGIAPSMGKGSRQKQQNYALLTVEKPTSAVAEAFRSLRTNLMFATRAGAPRVLNVTSTDASEGKSSTSINLATAFAQAGKSVLLIDADLRKPSLHKHFKLDNSKGLTHYLVGQETLKGITQTSFIPEVYVITSGPLSPNPVELLSSERLVELVAFADSPQCEFDIIILDSPPILGLADALVIGNRTHATLLVAAWNESRKRPLQAAFNRLRQARTNIIGVVMTKAKGNAGGDSYYNYDYYYSYGERKTLKNAA